MSSEYSSTDLSTLTFGSHSLRTQVDDHGEIWWVAKDVGDLLGLLNTRKSLAKCPANELGVTTGYTSAGLRQMITVNELGVYRLIFQSRKPEAEAFKLWVFKVLRTLRQTGAYVMPGRGPSKSSHHLPPKLRSVQEMAHVSEMLLAVWTTLRQAEGPLTNTEIAAKTCVQLRTVQRHTRYLLQLGLLDLYETFPQHLFLIAEQADKRHAAYYQRLERLAAIVEQRQHRLFA